MTLIERVARALSKNHRGDEKDWRMHVEDARVAVAAMRSTSQHMRIAGLHAWAKACGPAPERRPGEGVAEAERQRLMHLGSVSVSSAQLVPAWEAMIDAALEVVP